MHSHSVHCSIPFRDPADAPSPPGRDSLIAILDIVDNTLGLLCGCEFTKAGEGRALPFETAMAERLLTGWGNGTQKAVRAAIKGLAARGGDLSQEEISAILVIMNAQIERGFVQPMNKQIPGLISNGYNKARADIARKLKRRLTFSAIDSQSIQWLREHHLYWIGNYYNKHVSGRVAETIAEGMAEGLGRERIGGRLKEFFDKYPGVKVQPEGYWRGLAANGMNRSRNFGLVSGYQQIGVKQLRIVAVMDERTSPICFAAATHIKTDNGNRPIEQIRRGDYVLTGSKEWRRVKGVTSRISHSWVLLALSSGRLLTVTPEHPILTVDGWKSAGAIKKGDQLASQEHYTEGLHGVRKAHSAKSQGQDSSILFSGVLSEDAQPRGAGYSNVYSLRQAVPSSSHLCGTRRSTALQFGLPQQGRSQGPESGGSDSQVQNLRQEISHQTDRVLLRQDQEALFRQVPSTSRYHDVRRLWKRIRVCAIRIQSPQILFARLLSAVTLGFKSRIVRSGTFQGIWHHLQEGSPSRSIFNRLCLAEAAPGHRSGRRTLAYCAGGSWPSEDWQGHEGGLDSEDWLFALSAAAESTQERCGERSVEDYLRSASGSIVVTSVEGQDLSIGLPAFNIEVDDDPTYVAEGIVVHNCRELNGRVIPVAHAVQQRDALMAAEDPEDVKTIAPWLRVEQIAGQPTSQIMNMGIGLPPYHFNCRTTVVEE